MIVCVCNELRESDCREVAVKPTVKRATCIYRQLGCKVKCGACLKTMKSIVKELKTERESSAAQAAPISIEHQAA